MPFLLFLRKIPWQAWALLGILIAFAILRAHWIGVGEKRCEAKQEAAQAQADKEAAKQEADAPKVAEDAQADVKPRMEKRENEIDAANTIACDVEYPDGVQESIREAATASNPVRPAGSADRNEADNP